VEKPEEPLSLRYPEGLTACLRAQHMRRSPVAGDPALGRGQQNELNGSCGSAHVLLVPHQIAGEGGRREHERRRPVQLLRLLLAGHTFQRRECLRPENTKTPRLSEVMGRCEACNCQQLEQGLARHRLAAERLVRPPRGGQLVQAHASRAVTVTVAPARLRSWENGQPASAASTAACSAPSSTPSARTTI